MDSKDNKSRTYKDIPESPCKKLDCSHTDTATVCGLRQDGGGFKIRLFDNTCDLLKFNCENNVEFLRTDNYICNGLEATRRVVKDFYDINDGRKENDDVKNSRKEKNQTTGDLRSKKQITREPVENLVAIEISTEINTNSSTELKYNSTDHNATNDAVTEYNQINDTPGENNEVSDVSSGNSKVNDKSMENIEINEDLRVINDKNYNPENNKIRMFDKIYNSIEPTKVNDSYKDTKNGVKDSSKEHYQGINKTILVVVDGIMSKLEEDVNETIDNFFAATHVTELPLRNMTNEARRKMRIKKAGPIMVYEPWHIIPKNISDDRDHFPTLESCYHKCPKKCPDLYSPVCGSPGIATRMPSLMFKNHCFMDMAQCKLRWEQDTPNALAASYMEATFLFCLGEQLSGLHRFLPLVRTLQRMGRLKKKGHFKHTVRNMKFLNDFMKFDAKAMG